MVIPLKETVLRNGAVPSASPPFPIFTLFADFPHFKPQKLGYFSVRQFHRKSGESFVTHVTKTALFVKYVPFRSECGVSSVSFLVCYCGRSSGRTSPHPRMITPPTTLFSLNNIFLFTIVFYFFCWVGSVPYRTVPCRVVPYRTVSCRVVSYRAVSCRTVPCRRGVCPPSSLPQAVCADSDLSSTEQVFGEVLPQLGAGGRGGPKVKMREEKGDMAPGIPALFDQSVVTSFFTCCCFVLFAGVISKQNVSVLEMLWSWK